MNDLFKRTVGTNHAGGEGVAGQLGRIGAESSGVGAAHDVGATRRNVTAQHFAREFAARLQPDGRVVSAENFRLQEQTLWQYADDCGLLIPKRRIQQLEQFEFRGGEEHRIFIPADSDRMYKLTHRGKWGLMVMPEWYLKSLAALNVFSPTLNIRIEGVFINDGRPSVLSTHTFIEGEHPSGEELRYHMGRRGWRPERVNEFHNADGDEMLDAHPGNFLKTPDGNLYPIDVHFSPETADRVLQGSE